MDDKSDVRRYLGVGLGVGLLAAGLGGLFVLAAKDASPNVGIPLWAWGLAWGAVICGFLIAAVPPVSGLVKGRVENRRERLAAEAAEKAAYVPPTAEKPVYNEGRWWLVANRGSESSSDVECQVFDPIGRSSSQSFSQPDLGSVTLWYPNPFGISRPLPSGMHRVVWTLGTRSGSKEQARRSFLVGDDMGDLAALRNDLAIFRDRGQALLDESPPPDFDDWDGRIRTFYKELKNYFEQSPHLGKAQAMNLAFFHETVPPLEAARIEIGHFLERIDVLTAEFGGRPSE